MQKYRAILLLLALGIFLFPWQLVCATHPSGHNHSSHQAGKLSPCELRKQFQSTDPAFFPPMHCHFLDAVDEDFQAPEEFQIHPQLKTIEFLNEPIRILSSMSVRTVFLFPPIPKCRSATIITVNTLRGPPFF